jgi:TPR repeat protein
MCFFECSCSKAPNPAPKFHNQAIANYSAIENYSYEMGRHAIALLYGDGYKYQVFVTHELQAVVADPANSEEDLPSQFQLGEDPFFYKSYKQAFKWCQKAATLGDSYAMGELGLMYYYGEGTLDAGIPVRLAQDLTTQDTELVGVKDRKEAFKWLKKAAELGNSNAMGMLGVMYYYGMGTLKDPQQTKYWIKKAYEAGNNENAEKTWNTLELWKY